MKFMKFLSVAARFVQFGLLTILFALIYIQTSQVCVPFMPDLSKAQPGPIPSPFDFLIVSAGHAAVIMILILSSRWVSWKLSLAVFFAYFGVTTVMAQVETAYFLTGLTLPPGLLPQMVIMGFLTAAIFIPLAVIILWRVRKHQIDVSPNLRLEMPARQWVWKLAAIMPVYLVLYFGAGYFIAWQNPDLRSFYGGSDPGSFIAQILSIFRDDPWLTPFQMMRSLMWVMFVLPVIRMTRGSAWWTAVVVGLLLAVPMNIGHILPNPLIPQTSVRLSHMIETGSSNFVFGMVITWLFHREHRSLMDFFGLRQVGSVPKIEPQTAS